MVELKYLSGVKLIHSCARRCWFAFRALSMVFWCALAGSASAQTGPDGPQVERYTGEHADAWQSHVAVRLGLTAEWFLSGSEAAGPKPEVHVPDGPVTLPGTESPNLGGEPGGMGAIDTSFNDDEGDGLSEDDEPASLPHASEEGDSSGRLVDPGDPNARLLNPIVYTRVPRTHGDHTVILRDGSEFVLHSPDVWDRLPDSTHVFEGFNGPGQLVLRQPDGQEQILYDCVKTETPCVPLDPAVSPNGEQILFAVYRAESLSQAWSNGVDLPNRYLNRATEAQLYRYDIPSGSLTPLAHEPGDFDVSPAWLPDGSMVFASTRAETNPPQFDRGIVANRGREQPQIYRAAADGTEAVNITPHEVATAMHPYVLSHGRIAYSSHWLSHNLAYGSTNGSINWPGTLNNMWLVMDMDLRGGDMTALLGAHRHRFRTPDGRPNTMKALHFLGERTNGDICVANYYRGNNLGLGDVLCWPPESVGVEGALPRFLPRGIYGVANWSNSNDVSSREIGGVYQGKIGYPEGMSGGQLLLTVGRGYCTQAHGSVESHQRNVAEQPKQRACDVGLYHTTRIPSETMDDLAPVVDAPEWHEFGARVVGPRVIDEPVVRRTYDGSCELASSDAGTAETSPHRPYRFNRNYATAANNGGEIDGLLHQELAGMRFWEVLPNDRHTPEFFNATGNRLRWLGDVDLLEDKSFKVALPCDTPYIMAGIDEDGRVIKRDQVPQSLRPGEKRVCTGCHLHSRPGRPYERSLAFERAAVPLLESRPVPEFERDIRPILERRCQTCHVHDLPLLDFERLVLDYFQREIPEPMRVKVRDTGRDNRDYGLQRPYTSKYVNNMFARESLLLWKVVGERLDGRTDETYPDDINFGEPHPKVATPDEIELIGRWLDSGTSHHPGQD